MAKAKVELQITADIARLKTQLDKMNANVSRSWKRMQRDTNRHLSRIDKRMARTFSRTALASGVALAVVGRQIAGAVNVWGSYEASLSNVQAKTGALKTELGGVREAIISTSTATKFTMKQIADGAVFLAQAGLDVAQITANIPVIANVAAATGATFEEVADIVTNIAQPLGIATKDLAALGDVLVVATSNSNTNILEMGEAFKYAAPFVEDMGLDARKTAAFIGILGDAGVKASSAGTALRQVYAAMAKGVGEAVDGTSESLSRQGEVLNKLGVSLKDADGGLRDVVDVVRDLGAAGASGVDIFNIFGTRGSVAIKLIMKDLGGYDDLLAKIMQAEGAAAKQREVQMDNLVGDVDKLKSVFQAAQVAFASSGMGEWSRRTIQAVTKWLKDMGPFIDMIGAKLPGILDRMMVVFKLATAAIVKTITMLTEAFDKTATFFFGPEWDGILLGLSALGVYLGARMIVKLVMLVKWLGKLKTLIYAVLKASWALMLANPIVLAIAAITAAIVALYLYFEKEVLGFFTTIWDFLKYIGTSIQNFFIDIVNSVMAFVYSLINGFKEFEKAVKNFFGGEKEKGAWNPRSGESKEDYEARQGDEFGNEETDPAKTWTPIETTDVSDFSFKDALDKNIADFQSYSGSLEAITSKIKGMFTGIKTTIISALTPPGAEAASTGGDKSKEQSTAHRDPSTMGVKQVSTKTTGPANQDPSTFGGGRGQLNLGDSSPWQTFFNGITAGGMQAAGSLRDSFKTSLDDISKKLIDGTTSVRGAWLDTAKIMVGSSKKLSKYFKALAIVDTVINTYKAVTNAMSTVPYPANLAAAAQMLAMGFAQVNKIKGQSQAQYHGGITDVPNTGSYYLESGERVLSRELNKDLKGYMAQGMNKTKEKITNVYLEAKDKYTGEDIANAFNGSRGTVILQSVVR